METNLERIQALAEERDDENWEFRTYLKGKDGNQIDKRVHRLFEEVAAQIDCTACGNCCAVMWPTVTKADVERLASRFSMSPDAFEAEHVCEMEKDSLALIGQPCHFLKDKRCTVYSDRPEVCRSYPHLHKPDFVFRLMGVVSNYGVCPIVFNVYERLKDELGWRRPRR